MKSLLIATSNHGKFREIREIMEDTPLTFFSLPDLAIKADAPEDGETFAANALLKARYYFKKNQQAGGNKKMFVLAEDSGIIVDALAGELGVKTRRWGKGEKASDEEWIEYFLEIMSKVPVQKRTAAFICSAVLIDEQGKEYLAEGKTSGLITQNLEAPIYGGLPLSSCFKPDGFEHVYAALPLAQKNAVSHRGKAIRPFRDLFLQYGN